MRASFERTTQALKQYEGSRSADLQRNYHMASGSLCPQMTTATQWLPASLIRRPSDLTTEILDNRNALYFTAMMHKNAIIDSAGGDLRAVCLLFIASSAALPFAAMAESILIAPEWSAPAASSFLQDKKDGLVEPTASALGPEATLATTPSFPMLGLAKDFASPAPVASSKSFVEPMVIETASDWWPACAARSAIPSFAGEEGGEWASLTYEFGCVTVVILGDRRSDTTIPQALREELSDRTGDTETSVDEADDPDKVASVSYDIIRLNVPFVVTIECGEGAGAFCRDKRAHEILRSRLSVVGGEPRP